MRFSVEYSADEDNATAGRALSSIRPLGGAASPDGHRPRLPVELQRAARRAETAPPGARVPCRRSGRRPPLRSRDSVSLPCSLHEGRLSLHWEELQLKLKLSSGNIVLVSVQRSGSIRPRPVQAANAGQRSCSVKLSSVQLGK